MSLESPSMDALRATATQSPSKVKLWQSDCRQKWAYIYLMGRKRPPAAALAYGRAWDEAISARDEESYWSEVLKGNPHMSPKKLAELFDAKFGPLADEVDEWTGKDSRKDLQALGVRSTSVWVPQVGAMHHPLLLQKKWQLGLKSTRGDQFSINGVLDTVLYYDGPRASTMTEQLQDSIALRIGEKLPDRSGRPELAVIHDDKTAGATWLHRSGPNEGKPNKKATASLQPKAYTIAAEHDPDLVGKVDPNVFVFDVSLKNKTPEIQQVPVAVTAQERSSYLKLVEASRDEQIMAIDRGYFPPNRESNMCSRRWCSYWQDCVAEHGGEVQE